MCSGHSHSHSHEHEPINEKLARQQGAEMAELDLLWALEMAQKNYGLAKELIMDANQLGAGYVMDEKKKPFAREFMKAMLEGWRNANIEGLLQRDDLEEQGKAFILFCYYSQTLSLEDHIAGKSAATPEEAKERVEDCYRLVAEKLLGGSSPEQVQQIKEMSMKMDQEIHLGMKALATPEE